jgi:hypothetical protein
MLNSVLPIPAIVRDQARPSAQYDSTTDTFLLQLEPPRPWVAHAGAYRGVWITRDAVSLKPIGVRIHHFYELFVPAHPDEAQDLLTVADELNIEIH